MDEKRIYYLLQQELTGSLTQSESVELDEFKMRDESKGIEEAIATLMEREAQQPTAIGSKLEDAGFTNIMSVDRAITEQDEIPVIPITKRRFNLLKYAAAIIILIGVGTYLYKTNQKEKPSVTQTNPNPVQNDVAPGGNKAILTLADGTKINLDEAKSGTIATEGKTKISKIDNQVVYVSPAGGGGAAGGGPVSFNTMSTPRGGQYRLTLPDGSQVWLNAESSITYPTAFIGEQRKVSITGEAYFEIAKDKTKPFIVSVSPAGGGVREANGGGRVSPAGGGGAAGGGLEIEVLGTHFNVNAYTDEQTINTTLLEGSVRLKTTSSVSLLPSPKTSVLTLKPGQQGQLQGNRLSLASNPDLKQIMAWKNGNFYFDGQDLKSILKQFARWYDIKVVYQGPLKNRKFFGIVKRDKPLSHVLQLLKDNDIRFRIENRTLIVQSD